MRLRDIVLLLDGHVLLDDTDLGVSLETACGADLMSDVLTFVHPGSLLLTGLTNLQVIRTAEIVDAGGVVFVRGKVPPPETAALARERGIPIICSPYTLFECCGRLYAAGMESCDVRGERNGRAGRRVQESNTSESCSVNTKG